MSLRYDQRNCQPQCISCNRMQDGNEKGFRYGLIQKYGSGVIDELHGEKRKTLKYCQMEIDAMADFLKDKIKELLKEKGL